MVISQIIIEDQLYLVITFAKQVLVKNVYLVIIIVIYVLPVTKDIIYLEILKIKKLAINVLFLIVKIAVEH